MTPDELLLPYDLSRCILGEPVDIELLAPDFCRISFPSEGIVRRVYFWINQKVVIFPKWGSYPILSFWMTFNRIFIKVLTIYVGL